MTKRVIKQSKIFKIASLREPLASSDCPGNQLTLDNFFICIIIFDIFIQFQTLDKKPNEGINLTGCCQGCTLRKDN